MRNWRTILQRVWQSDGFWVVLLGLISWQLALRFPDGATHYRITSDAEGYYQYLPGIFIYDGFVDMPLNQPEGMVYVAHSGKYLSRYTYGVALCEAPFFLVAHLIASNGWFKARNPNGFSNTYNDILFAATIFYVMMGIWVLLKVLNRTYSRKISWFTVLLIYLGTNLFFYTVGNLGMSHPFTFFWVSLLLFLTPDFLNKPSRGRGVKMALVLGLILLIRPTNVVLILYLLFYEVYRWQDLRDRMGQLIGSIRFWWFVPLIMFLFWVPQLFYWKYITGQWVFYSYTGYGFSHWKSPYIGSVLFSIQNGFFVYSPIMLFAVLGLGLGLKKKIHSSPGVSLILLISIYLFASWEAWWFGGAYGHRAFIDLFPFLSLGAWLVFVQNQNWLLRILFGILSVILVYYSLGLTYLYRHPWEGPDWTWHSLWEQIQLLF